MNVLVIGGTQFVGRYLVEALLRDKHEITLFHRGKTNKGLFDGVAEIYGDRDEGFEALGDGPWDAVVDTCAYVPSQVERAVEYFSGKVKHYVFVSTISVYSKDQEPLIAETGKLLEPIYEDKEITGETYGAMKVACEEILNKKWGGGLTHIRPGVVLGPHDPTQRFPYWPLRYSLGGKVLVPDAPGELVTGVDVRDLGDFMALCVRESVTGTYNVDNDGTTFGDIIAASESVAAGGTMTVWVDPAKLEGLAQPWRDIPIWANGGLVKCDPSEAKEKGLKYRSLGETTRDTLKWVEEEGIKFPLKGAWDLEREAEVLNQLGL